MRVEIFALCDAATDDAGKLNILGTFDSVFVKVVPAVHPHCAVALRLRFDAIEAGKHKVSLRFVDADGKGFLPPIDGELELKAPPGAASVVGNLVLGIQGMNLPSPGRYSIDLAVDGRSEASLPLFVVVRPAGVEPRSRAA